MRAMETLPAFFGILFGLIGAISGLGGLLFTLFTIREDAKARKIGNIISLTQQHREIWKEVYSRPELARIITERAADLNKEPISPLEEFTVKFLILHLATVYAAEQEGMSVTIEGMEKDIREFFAFSIPNAVWNRVKKFQNSGLVSFIEDTMNNNPAENSSK
jgi:hypothetical protein